MLTCVANLVVNPLQLGREGWDLVVCGFDKELGGLDQAQVVAVVLLENLLQVASDSSRGREESLGLFPTRTGF